MGLFDNLRVEAIVGADTTALLWQGEQTLPAVIIPDNTDSPPIWRGLCRCSSGFDVYGDMRATHRSPLRRDEEVSAHRGGLWPPVCRTRTHVGGRPQVAPTDL